MEKSHQTDTPTLPETCSVPDRSDAKPRHPSGKFQPGVSSPNRPTVRWVRSGERAKDNEAAKESDHDEDMENEEDTEVVDHGVDDESAETSNPKPQGKRSTK